MNAGVGVLGTVLVTLAWALAIVMAVCFLAALAAIRFARQGHGAGRQPGQDPLPGGKVEAEAPRRPERPAAEREEYVGLDELVRGEDDAEEAPKGEAPRDESSDRLAHPDPFARADAVAALKDRPDGEARLLDALRDEYPVVRREAVRALREIGTPQAVTALVWVAGHDSSAEVREEAVAALGTIVRERNRGRLGDA